MHFYGILNVENKRRKNKNMPNKESTKIFYALSVAWQLGFFIAVPIVAFLGVGFLADRFLNTEPLFILLGLGVGIATTCYESYHLIVPLIKETNHDNSKH